MTFVACQGLAGCQFGEFCSKRACLHREGCVAGVGAAHLTLSLYWSPPPVRGLHLHQIQVSTLTGYREVPS